MGKFEKVFLPRWNGFQFGPVNSKKIFKSNSFLGVPTISSILTKNSRPIWGHIGYIANYLGNLKAVLNFLITPGGSSCFRKHCTLHYLPQDEPETTYGGQVFQNFLISSHTNNEFLQYMHSRLNARICISK